MARIVVGIASRPTNFDWSFGELYELGIVFLIAIYVAIPGNKIAVCPDSD